MFVAVVRSNLEFQELCGHFLVDFEGLHVASVESSKSAEGLVLGGDVTKGGGAESRRGRHWNLEGAEERKAFREGWSRRGAD